MVTGQQVADFLGRGDSEATVALAGEHVVIVTAMAQAYTRGKGFDGAEPKPDVEAVIVTATARLVSNPGQIVEDQTAGPFSQRVGVGFTGWNLAETMVLNRYRQKAK